MGPVATLTSAPATPETSPLIRPAGAEPCTDRLLDCRCGVTGPHITHACAVPGCGGVWTFHGDALRLPCSL